MEKPNILLIVVDCLRGDRAYGESGGARIPTLQALTEGGTAFTKAVSSAANTSPAFASLLSSLFGFRHGVRSLRGYKMKEGFPTLPEVLGSAGYHSRAELTGPLRRSLRLDRGFDDCRYRSRSRTIFSSYLRRFTKGIEREMKEPWFLMLHLWALHRPRKIRHGWNDVRYGETIYDRSLSSIDEQIGILLESVRKDRTLVVLTGDHGERYNDRDNHRDNHRVASPLRFLEHRMDRLHHRRKRRREKKIEAQGREVPLDHLHGFHVYEDVTRVPIIFSGPGVPAGTTVSDLVRHVDIGPTLLELAGVEPPQDFGRDGRSLVPLMRGEALPPAPAYMEATGVNLRSPTRWIASVRTDRLKYCKGLLDPDIPEELYDLEADPEEQNNLAPDDPRMPEMRRLLEDVAGDLATNEIAVSLSDREMEELDATLKALGYLD
jgi:arylsulfatase A-like enzyme